MPTPTDDVLFVPLPQRAAYGGLGRHIRHDPRSRQYRVGRTAAPKTVQWARRIPILDQGQIGSCTGNATVGVLGTDPYYDTLSDDSQRQLTEDLAVAIYSAATKIDAVEGTYPPEDTGSDGLSVAKVAKAGDWVSGYQHVLSLGEAYAAIQAGPFITGTLFYEGMESPDREGLVEIRGKVLGGHEYVVDGYDAERDEWWFSNSWSESWGKDGRFKMTGATYSRLLRQQGDATPFVPLDKPAPIPTPQPVPTPVDPVGPPPGPVNPTPPTPDPAAGVVVPDPLVAELDTWAVSPHRYHVSSALAKDWRRFRG